MKVKAAASDEFASRYHAAMTRLSRFEEVGPPHPRPREQDLAIRLRGDRTGKGAIVCEQLELTGRTLLDILHRGDDNRDGMGREAAARSLDRFEGTVMAVTHDRWFARVFDRYLVFGADGQVYESAEPV